MLLRPSCQLLHRRSIIKLQPCQLHQSTRLFHASAPRKDVYSTMLYLPHELLLMLHSSGLSWAYALPASAFIVRTAVVLLGGIRSQKRLQRYLALNPLREAITSQTRKEMLRNQSTSATPSLAQKTALRAIREDITALNRRWNSGPGASWMWQFWQLPAFVAMAETIRRMMGLRSGLLSWFLDSATMAPPAVVDPGEVQTLQVRLMETDHSLNPWYTPSFADEGFLWFPNLLLPDPYCILPVTVSGLMIFNIWWSSRTRKSGTPPGKWSKRLRRMLYSVAGLSLLITPSMPAGLVFYWASGSLSATLWHFWVDWRYPMPPVLKAGKRPLLMMPDRGSGNR